MSQQTMFPEAPPQTRRYSMLELISCAERELRLRRQVYPKRVADGKMSRALADSETAKMEQILAKLKEYGAAEGWGV